jgi:hypothetical protein
MAALDAVAIVLARKSRRESVVPSSSPDENDADSKVLVVVGVVAVALVGNSDLAGAKADTKLTIDEDATAKDDSTQTVSETFIFLLLRQPSIAEQC